MKVSVEITAKWPGKGRSPKVNTVQAYSVDSAMDTDTDSWTVEIGDVDRNLVDVLRRDTEVTMRILDSAMALSRFFTRIR
jgi:hypothetical protein